MEDKLGFCFMVSSLTVVSCIHQRRAGRGAVRQSTLDLDGPRGTGQGRAVP
jgi:hypothetical protein